MKNITKIFALTTIVMLFGCKKYLDQQPTTEIGTKELFSTEQGAYQALIGVYSRLSGDQGYGIRLSLYFTVDNDETQGPSGSPTGDGDRRDMSRYKLTASNAQLEKPFNQLFQGIDFANTCIYEIPKMELYNGGDENQKKRLRRMYAEALTLRAQFYFEAIRIWGDLPAHFEPAYVQASKNPFPKRTNKDSLYAILINDLATAIPLIPWANEVSTIGDQPNERLTKASAKALRARLALFAGGYALNQNGVMTRIANYQQYYQIAKQECADIMANGQHSLNPSYKNLWKEQIGKRVAVDPNGELLFQVTGIGASGVEDTKLGYYDGPQIGSFGNKSINILPTYFYLFDSADTRRDVTCAIYNMQSDAKTKIGTAITAINQGKWRKDWTGNITDPALQYVGGKWQIIRYSDVLLMFAEADNELNGAPTAAAYDAINKVHRRGFGQDINTANPSIDIPAGLSKTDFFDAIVKERSLEFGGEGVRKFDLIRWNLLSKKIKETKAALALMGTVPAPAPYDQLPTSMYYYTGTTADDVTIWSNSFYKKAPTSTPAGTTKVSWLGSGIISTILGAVNPFDPNGTRYAAGFRTGISELFPIPQKALDANPNLKQNPGY